MHYAGDIAQAVEHETGYQDDHWGPDHDRWHGPRDWVVILAGLLYDARVYARLDLTDQDLRDYRAQLVKVAATSLNALKALDQALGAPNDVQVVKR